jgi:hypothetical protein
LCGVFCSLTDAQANSLTAASLVHEIRERSGVSLNPSFLLSGLTPSQLADYVRREMADPQQGTRALRFQAMPSVETELGLLRPILDAEPAWLSASAGSGVFVTGAAGFLGRHIVRALLQTLPDRKIFALVRAETASVPAGVVQLVGDIAEPHMVGTC